MGIISSNPPTWSDAVSKAGLTKCGAVLAATLRLLLWHLMQPALYWWALWSYWEEIDHLQLIAGQVVGAREAIYAFVVLLVPCVHPPCLLADPKTFLKCDDIRNNMHDFLMYVFTPEKFLIMGL